MIPLLREAVIIQGSKVVQVPVLVTSFTTFSFPLNTVGFIEGTASLQIFPSDIRCRPFATTITFVNPVPPPPVT